MQQDSDFADKAALVLEKINQTITTMQTVIFENDTEFGLWPEMYTDYFNFATNANADELTECLHKAQSNAGEAVMYRQGHHLFTDDQVLVQELKEMLYAFEIAYQHTHIPNEEKA